MRRLLSMTGGLCACACVCAAGLAWLSPPDAAASHHDGGGAHAAAPRAQLQAFACHHAVDPVNRTVAVRSVMRPLAHTRSLQVRFELLRRGPGDTTATSVGRIGDLGVWRSPADRTLGRRAGDVWKLSKSVSDLDAPARYRFEVDYRWRGAHGATLRTATRRTGFCTQRELRPDVAVTGVTVAAVPGHPQRARYVAHVANRGPTGSGPFAVQFQPGSGAAAISRPIASLAGHETVKVVFSGPACDPAAPPAVTADPDNRVDDSDRADNAVTVACPAS